MGQRIHKSVTSIAAGDADGNNLYDAADFTAIVQQILGNSIASGNPDCTDEGAVDVRDLVCLNNLINSSTQPSSATATTLFAYDEAGHLMGEYDGSGTAIREMVYLYDTPVAVITQGATYFIQTDHLGTPQQLTDSLDVTVWSAQYDPFGKAEVNDDPDGDGNSIAFNQRFPGQYYDGETGLHYNYFRYYDPSTGRYITSDPIGLEGGLNTYLYAYANPLTFIDPDGLVGLFGHSTTLNAFKRGPHRLSNQDSIAISQFSNRVAGASAITAAAGPLAAALAAEASTSAAIGLCRGVAKNKDAIRKAACAAGFVASCGEGRLNELDKIKDDLQMLERIRRASQTQIQKTHVPKK